MRLNNTDIKYLIKNISKKTKIDYCLYCNDDLNKLVNDSYKYVYLYLRSKYEKTTIKNLDVEFESLLRDQKITDYMLTLFNVDIHKDNKTGYQEIIDFISLSY